MLHLEKVSFINVWRDNKKHDVLLDKNFTVLTGYNGSGKSTLLELLHDSFSLVHDGDFLTDLTNWSSEIQFKNNISLRTFNYLDLDYSKEKDEIISRLDLNDPAEDIFTSHIRFNDTILSLGDEFSSNKKTKELSTLKESSRRKGKSSCITFLINAEQSEYPNSILYKNEQFYYNTDHDEDAINDLDIFSSDNSIDKTLYLLLNEYVAKSAQYESKIKSKDEFLAFITKLALEHEDNNKDSMPLSDFDEKIHSVLNQLYEKYKSQSKNKWRAKLHNLLEKFFKLTNRKLVLDNNGYFSLELKNGRRVKWHNFSRGEKTLLSLFLIVFLNREENVIFIFDEPDLSLHIEWQDLLLPAFKELAPNRKFIISTHSPALIGNVGEHFVNVTDLMES
ncbi:AAA family ATPase [Serratia marcescens]|nr:AAA family ATPase [Serratia marcescens]